MSTVQTAQKACREKPKQFYRAEVKNIYIYIKIQVFIPMLAVRIHRIYVNAFLHVSQALQMPLESLPAKKHDSKKQGCQR